MIWFFSLKHDFSLYTLKSIFFVFGGCTRRTGWWEKKLSEKKLMKLYNEKPNLHCFWTSPSSSSSFTKLNSLSSFFHQKRALNSNCRSCSLPPVITSLTATFPLSLTQVFSPSISTFIFVFFFQLSKFINFNFGWFFFSQRRFLLLSECVFLSVLFTCWKA